MSQTQPLIVPPRGHAAAAPAPARLIPPSPLNGVDQLPPDPILGLSQRFKEDARPDAVNLASGVYQDEDGQTPTMRAVREAELARWGKGLAKGYLPIAGRPEFGAFVQELLFGKGHPLLAAGHACTAHCAGGTGALRVAAQVLHRLNPEATVWVSDPTWPNHPGIFASVGLRTSSYPYAPSPETGLDFDGLMGQVKRMRAGDAAVLQVCCHNPTGIDPGREQWRELIEAVERAGVVPVFDFAYQGFAESVAADAWPLRHAAERGLSFLVASSLSKNMGLYQERTGALTAVAATRRDAEALQSQIESCIRTLWSNPPAHGADVALRVASSPRLREAWLAELDACRERIAAMRRAFAATMNEADPSRDYGRYAEQRGMFSLLPLTRQQVDRLRDEDAIYLVGSGRLNFCGLNAANLDRVCAALGGALRR